MTRFLRRLSLLFVPLTVAIAGQALPGRAQQPLSPRYAFADTLLLRDTLGLKFDGIFPAADSLGLSPDTLRALMIRYRFSLLRLLALSDSMSVPVDSVGPAVDRERLNPLAGGRGRSRDESSLRYTSGWSIQRTNSSWTNSSEYRMRRGPWYANNQTDITLERYKSVASTNLRQVREMRSEGGARLNERQSFGLFAHTMLFDNFTPGDVSNQKETLNELQLKARTQKGGRGGGSTYLNLLGGYLNDDRRGTEIKRGLKGSADGRVRTLGGNWLSNDLLVGTSANVARTRRPTSIQELRALDLSTNVNGTLTLFSQSPVGLNMNYNFRRTRVDTPNDQGLVNHVRQANEGVTGTVRVRRDNEHTLNVVGNIGDGLLQTGRRRDYGGKASLRWLLRGWAVDGNYSDGRSKADYPRTKSRTYGYIERSTTRSADSQFQRTLGPRIQTKITTSINLTRYRYEATADSASPPSPRDTYRQSYRAEGRYNPTQRFTSGVALEVVLARTINIERLTTASNNDTRSYRGEWTWSYLMFQGLTVAQNNQISADYQFYPFAPDRNTLGLNYNTVTSLNAVITPRLSVVVTHSTQQSPRGSYTRASDGLEYLRLSDEARNFGLHSSIRYSPTPSVSFSLEPDYRANVREGTSNGVSAKQRDDRRLDMSGHVDLNLRLGSKGTVTGGISRTFQDSRSTTFSNGLPTISPRSITDFWNGNLSLTWQL
jgi:hypothetical protein